MAWMRGSGQPIGRPETDDRVGSTRGPRPPPPVTWQATRGAKVLQWDVIGNTEQSVLADPVRLRSVRRLGEPGPDAAFDRVAMLVRKLVDAPLCVVCLVGAERQHLAGQVGMPEPI